MAETSLIPARRQIHRPKTACRRTWPLVCLAQAVGVSLLPAASREEANWAAIAFVTTAKDITYRYRFDSEDGRESPRFLLGANEAFGAS